MSTLISLFARSIDPRQQLQPPGQPCEKAGSPGTRLGDTPLRRAGRKDCWLHNNRNHYHQRSHPLPSLGYTEATIDGALEAIFFKHLPQNGCFDTQSIA